MAGRSSKKKQQDNFEKIKREMAGKKQKAQTQQNPAPEEASLKHEDLPAEPGQEYLGQAQGQGLEIIDKGGRDSRPGKEPEGDIVKQGEQEYKANTGEARKIQLLVFQVGEEEFALKVSNIKGITRISAITKVPKVPEYITGLCSINGDLLPLIDSRKLFGMPEGEYNESSRIIIADINGKRVGLVADKVSEVITVEEAAIKEPSASIRGRDGGDINGFLILNDGKRVIMILAAETISKAGNLDVALNREDTTPDVLTDSAKKEDQEEQIVIFNIGKGEYAFDVSSVQGIIRLPDVKKVPNTADYIEGVFSFRNQLLAVVNPGKLLGLDCKQPDKSSRVIVVNNGSFSYGVIVDKVSYVVRVPKKLFKESELSTDCSAASFVKGIFSLDNGKRLVLSLAAHKLVSWEDLQVALDVGPKKAKDKSISDGEAADNLDYVVFKLGKEEYGIAINNLQEINRISQITHFPAAPSFIAGMVDLRGEIIPILDLRKLFNAHDSYSDDAAKYLVVESGKKKIGILVDSVSEIIRITMACLEVVPEAFKGKEQDSYIDKIARLNDGKRIILLLNLSALLSFM